MFDLESSDSLAFCKEIDVNQTMLMFYVDKHYTTSCRLFVGPSSTRLAHICVGSNGDDNPLPEWLAYIGQRPRQHKHCTAD